MVHAEGYEHRTNRSGLILTAIAAFVIAALVFGGSILFLMENDRDLVSLKADSEPYKVRPSEPGGLKLENLDSPVLGLLDPKSGEETGREVLTPPESAPELPPIAVDGKTAAAPDATGAAVPADGAADGKPPAGETPPAEAAAPQAEKAAPPPQAAAAPAPGSAGKKPAGDQPSNKEIDAAVAQVAGTPKPRPKAAQKIAVLPGDGPFFVVQFAAFKSERNASNTAAVLAAKHASRLDEVSIVYMQSGEYWRVMSEPLPRPEANDMCAMFRSVGQDCIVKLVESGQ